MSCSCTKLITSKVLCTYVFLYAISRAKRIILFRHFVYKHDKFSCESSLHRVQTLYFAKNSKLVSLFFRGTRVYLALRRGKLCHPRNPTNSKKRKQNTEFQYFTNNKNHGFPTVSLPPQVFSRILPQILVNQYFI